MSPLPMDLPQAGIGHNSHASEIIRPDYDAAAEAKAARGEFLQMVLRHGVTRRFEIINRAYASDMSDAEFRVLYGYMQHGNRDGCNISVGLARIALITGKGESSVRRTMKSLEASGWFAAEKQRREAATRTGAIPPQAMLAILTEVVDRSISSGQPIVVPPVYAPQPVDRSNSVDRSLSSGLEVANLSGQEVKTAQICKSRPLTFENITKEDKPNTPGDAGARIHARIDPPSWAMNAALSPAEQRAQSRIWRTEGGGLAISEDLRAELARDFPLVPIDETLRIVKTESGANDTAMHLERQVERKFSYAQRDEVGRERRYQQRASEAARTALPPGRQQNWRAPSQSNGMEALYAEIRAKHPELGKDRA